MTHQEVFDKVVTHLATQKQRAMSHKLDDHLVKAITEWK